MEEYIKIAVCSTAHPFDDSRVFHRQAHSLSKHYYVTVYSCAPFGERQFCDRLKVIGLPLWKTKYERFRNLFILFKYVRKSNADIYIFHDTIGMLLIPYIKIIKKKKTIYDIHENFHGWIREKDWIPRFLRSFLANTYSFFEKIVLKFTDMIWFAVSDIGDHYSRYSKLKKMLVGNYPSLDQIQKINQTGVTVKNQFIFVGSMDSDRSIVQIIKAFDRFCERNSQYELILAGNFYTTEYEVEVRELLNSLKTGKKIKILGRIDYQEALLQIAESKVGFSLHQPTYNFRHGMPLKLLEYAGMGTPVIASNFANFKRIVESAEYGKCVNPNNIQEITEAMHFLISDEPRRQKMGLNGKKLVENVYNWEKVSIQIVQEIRNLYAEA